MKLFWEVFFKVVPKRFLQRSIHEIKNSNTRSGRIGIQKHKKINLSGKTLTKFEGGDYRDVAGWDKIFGTWGRDVISKLNSIFLLQSFGTKCLGRRDRTGRDKIFILP